MNFSITDGVFEKLVEVKFTDEQTSSFGDFVNKYNEVQGNNAAQTELILQFLKTISD